MDIPQFVGLVLIGAVALTLAFVCGAIFGAWVYSKGRERSSPVPSFVRREKPDSPGISPAKADEEFELKRRANSPVKA